MKRQQLREMVEDLKREHPEINLRKLAELNYFDPNYIYSIFTSEKARRYENVYKGTAEAVLFLINEARAHPEKYNGGRSGKMTDAYDGTTYEDLGARIKEFKNKNKDISLRLVSAEFGKDPSYLAGIASPSIKDTKASGSLIRRVEEMLVWAVENREKVRVKPGGPPRKEEKKVRGARQKPGQDHPWRRSFRKPTEKERRTHNDKRNL